MSVVPAAMQRACRRAAIALVSFVWLTAACAAEVEPRAGVPFGAGLAACVERALPEGNMRQMQAVAVVSESGWTRESSRQVYWQRLGAGDVDVLFVVVRPKSDAGLKLLVSQRSGGEPILYVYSPDIGRARRVVGSGASSSVLGTDFTFEDAMHVQGFLQAAGARQVDDQRLDGVPMFVAETQPAPDTSAYGLIRTYIDQRTCLPMQTEFFGPGGTLDKTLILAREAVTEIAGRWIPLRMTMFNHKQRQRTELTATEVAIDTVLPDGLFTLTEIQKSH